MDRHVRRSSPLHILCLLVLSCAIDAQAINQGPATAPASEATVLLSKIDAAYTRLKTAQLDGHIVGHFDVAGQHKDADLFFTSSFSAPNRFRHEAKGDILIGSTGQTAYALEQNRNIYISADAPKERESLVDWPHAVVGILQQQNPSLLLLLSKSATDGLKGLGDEVTRLPDTALDGVLFPTLQFDLPSGHQVITMLIDSKTSLVRQVRFDLRKSLEARGATDVKSADITIDYTQVKIDQPVDVSQFAWAPPPGATVATASPENGGEDDAPAMALVGKPAPDFTLTGLDEKPVKLSSLKGTVVVLDFFATWCGPCVYALPHTDQLFKEQSTRGLQVFAVNQQEDKDTVKSFANQAKLSLPILLDTDGTVGNLFMVGGIPQFVVIGKDGIVKRVFVGVREDTLDQIKAIAIKEMGN